jgi:flagellin-like hook-associated protein FlgL
MLTPEMARETFQSAVPARLEDFEEVAAKCLQEASRRNDPQRTYLAMIMREAKKELRHRLNMANERVRQMIDSGWVPKDAAERIDSVYRNMFSQENHWNRNAFNDLYAAIQGAHARVGIGPTLEEHQIYVLEFSQYNVDVATEFAHDLEFYMAAKQPNNGNVTNLTLQGDVNYLQTGGTANVVQNIGANAGEIVDALLKLKAAVNESSEKNASAIVDLIDKTIEETKKPNAVLGTAMKFLDGVQNLIRTTGAVPAAYNLLAAIVASHGGHLTPLPPGA